MFLQQKTQNRNLLLTLCTSALHVGHVGHSRPVHPRCDVEAYCVQRHAACLHSVGVSHPWIAAVMANVDDDCWRNRLLHQHDKCGSIAFIISCASIIYSNQHGNAPFLPFNYPNPDLRHGELHRVTIYTYSCIQQYSVYIYIYICFIIFSYISYCLSITISCQPPFAQRHTTSLSLSRFWISLLQPLNKNLRIIIMITIRIIIIIPAIVILIIYNHTSNSLQSSPHVTTSLFSSILIIILYNPLFSTSLVVSLLLCIPNFYYINRLLILCSTVFLC